MAKMIVMGINEYTRKLEKLGKSGEKIAGKAIYSAAGIVADKIKENISSLETVSDTENLRAYKNGGKSRLTVRQKADLLSSFGISPMEMDDKGYYNVKLGFDGYNSIRTKKYPKGQPNQLIARVVESGSSYMDKQPFIRTAVQSAKKSAEEEMQRVIDEETKKIMR